MTQHIAILFLVTTFAAQWQTYSAPCDTQTDPADGRTPKRAGKSRRSDARVITRRRTMAARPSSTDHPGCTAATPATTLKPALASDSIP
ncbi:MAG: hypothetical protein ACREJ0_17520, partial [Geminicoccaceae bacterium]